MVRVALGGPFCHGFFYHLRADPGRIFAMKQPTPVFTGNVVDGSLKIIGVERMAMDRHIRSFATGTQVDIVIRKHRNNRTHDQNNYYWGVVVKILGDFFGYDPEDMHTELKRLFNPIVSKLDGSTIGGSTAKMSTVEFFHDQDSYVERICRWAATEHGVNIPPPKRNGNGGKGMVNTDEFRPTRKQRTVATHPVGPRNRRMEKHPGHDPGREHLRGQ